MDNGYYVHPFTNFRSTVQGSWGFNFADDDTGDLPSRLQVAFQQSTIDIWKLLSKKDMFPKESKIPDIVSRCYGDGYMALKQIMFP